MQKNLREEKVLQNGRSSKFGVQQNAAKNSQSIFTSAIVNGTNVLQKIRQGILAPLEEPGPESSYTMNVSIDGS
jgi:hypothetical protein